MSFRVEYQSSGRSVRGQSRGAGQGRGRGDFGRIPNRPPRGNDDNDNWRSRDLSSSRSRGRTNERTVRPPQRGRGPGRRPPTKPEDPPSLEVQVEDVICHTFLPKILPSNLQEHLVEVEERLTEYVLSGINDSIKDVEGFLQLEPSQAMFQRWKYIQPKWRSDWDEEHFAFNLKQELENQKEGDTIPIYIRKQNCTLLITKLSEEFTQLSTFTPMLCSETVMSSVGSLNAKFPQTCDFIYNKDLLMSNVFLYHIHQLAVEDFEVSLPVIIKGETKYTDYRDVPDPFLVHMMIGTLVPAEIYNSPEDSGTQVRWQKLGNDLSVYVPEVISPFQVNKIQKKVRDQVNCEMSAKAIPFRRSGMWMSLKVTLMLKLVQDLGNSAQAHLVYKLIILRTLSQICYDYLKERGENIDLSLASQLVAKLGRRVEKLRRVPPLVQEDEDELSTTIAVMKQKCIENCYNAVKSLKIEMPRIWKQVSSTHPIINPIMRKPEEFQEDLFQDIPWLDVQINTSISKNRNYKEWSKRTRAENMQKAESLTKCADFQRSLQIKRYTTIDSIIKTNHAFNSQFSQVDDTFERVWIHDTELFIKFVFDVNEIVEDTSIVQDLVVAYFKNAVPRYTIRNDVVGCNQMILVILKAIQILDEICTRQFPVLLEHNSGVKTCLFDKLLLPHEKDILLLNELQNYFNNRNGQARFPSLIKNNEINQDEFSVRFARQDEMMQETRQRIWRDTKIAEKAKEEEFIKVKKECEKLDRELRELGGRCEATEVNDGRTHDNRKGNRSFDSIDCRRCKLNSILRFKRRSVKIYERPLPMPPPFSAGDDFLEYAVVFELKIPPEIALLRDALALLNFEILGQPIFEGEQERRNNESEKPPPMEDWRKYMNRKGASQDYKSKGGSALNSIVLVTSRIASSESNVTKINPDVLTASIENFIVYNGLDCAYFHEKPLWFPIVKDSRNISTFQIKSTSQPDAAKYENLQWTLESTSHFQNKVIATHIQCHRQLTPEEYTEFGSIRADGNRVQLRKLYHAISDRAISLHKEPVLALVLQTLWQVGPRNQYGIRESHEDFLSKEFSLEFLDLLGNLVTLCEGNYSEPLVVLIAIVITLKILEVNSDEKCRDSCYTLLKSCRNVVNGMVEKIERHLVTYVDKPGKDADASVNFLKDRLLEATLCSLFSYHVGNEDLVKIVVKSKDDYVHWFHGISRLHQLTDEEQCHKSLSPFLQVLLNTAKGIPLKLELQSHLNSVSSKNVMLQSLHQFAYEKCPNVKECILSTNTWKFFNEKDHPNMLFAGYEEKEISATAKVKVQHFLSLDLIQGTFLVNGFPQSNLPSVILTHPLFKRYFKDSKFRIQRYSTRARTIDRFYGKHYDFELIVHQGDEKDMFDVGSLIIREIQEEPKHRILDMLEPALFRNIVGCSFVDNYTHWLDAENKAVYFRRLPKEDADYRRPHDYTLAQDEKGKWRFYDEIHKKFLLSIDSHGFSLVTSALSRLESKEEINVLLDEKCGKVTAKLPRYQLSFDLVNDKLHSVEFTNFRIAENQNMGTLIGLEQGLLLELGDKPDKYSKRMLIVPHGYLQVRLLQLKYHHNTFLDLNYLRQPSFFTYDYDTVLRQLKADKSQAAWLYLAALHATTSSPMPDPFTEVTGTERCIEILKSGRVFPSQPYGKESLKTLTMIRDLAPRRSYYSHGISFRGKYTCRYFDEGRLEMRGPREKMEITQWPDVIGCMAAYDGLALIVDKLIENGGRLIELHKGPFPSQKIQRPRHIVSTRDVGIESGKLQIRSYTRHLSMYNQTCFVPKKYFMDSFGEELGTGENLNLTLRKEVINEGKCVNDLLLLSRSRLVNTFEGKPVKQWKNEKAEIHSFLYSKKEPIAALVYSDTVPNTLEGLPIKDLLNLDFVVNWLQLYAWAKDPSCGESHAFTMVLAALAFRGNASLQQVIHLHHISLLAREVQFPEVPAFAHPQKSTTEIGRQEKIPEDTSDENLIYLQECNYISEEIQAILRANMVSSNAAGVEENDEAALEQHLKNVCEDAERIEKELGKYWPCESISKKSTEVKNLFDGSNIRFSDAMDEVNMKIGLWYRSVLLNDFLKRVEKALNTVLADQVAQGKMEELEELYGKFQYSNFAEVNVEFTVRVDEVQELHLSEMMANFNMENLAEAQAIFETGNWRPDEKEVDFVEQRKMYAEKIAELTNCIQQSVEGNASDLQKKIIYLSGIVPRVTSTNFLPYLTDPTLTEEETPFWIYIGAIAVLYTHLKRLNRCIALKKKGESVISELIKERNNQGHENWHPKRRPEWLLLELELDIMIRPHQVIVAERMMEMPDGNNGVMQLNMGEGKTSVIVPMICASLASEDQVCRVTVLTSIFKTNLNILRFAIGGLLSRRVYTFPCRRNVLMTERTAQIMLGNCLEECRKVKGVILTVPEYRLSFSLYALDKILKKEIKLGNWLLHIENWLKYYCRDILDESDELLNVKNQLVYTIGSRQSIDGGSLRWTICQKVLQSVCDIAEELQERYENVIEFDPIQQANVPEQFTTFRLINDECLEEFKELVVEQLLDNYLKLDGVERLLAKIFMTEEMISEENHSMVMDSLVAKPELLKKVLLISAYLRREVMIIALRKRWRVEYGVNPIGEKLMAVPFRAKDVAEERTEFGHPDLAIVLTHLSYYYSGLSYEQFRECIELLKNRLDGEEIYDDWVAENVPSNLRSFHRINMSDSEQAGNLFGILRKHKKCIDFWLSHVVFPRESKQYTGKLVTTGGHLCHERNRHRITGFSGTNDSQDLLPLSIRQQDHPDLLETNKKVEAALLRPENKNHKGFKMGVTCKEILQEMRNDSLRILIDAGALMVDCNNEQVAELWLTLDEDAQAAVYFMQNGEEMVKCRNDDTSRKIADIRLEESPYKHELDKCVVFLDDQHTRGVDLKFPVGSRACVTVGSRMKREKLVQACMRMRKLEKEHTVTFYLSYEAHQKVNDGRDNISTKDVLKWTQQNTDSFNQDGLLYLSLNALNYAQTLVALDSFYYPTPYHHHAPSSNFPASNSKEKLDTLVEQFGNEEVTTLMEMYGHYSKKKLLTEVIPIWFEITRNRLNGGARPVPQPVLANFDRIQKEILQRCQTVCEDKTVFSSCTEHVIEEEQEKELEKEMEKEKETEVEEEREVQQPGPPKEFKPSLHPNVELALINGGDHERLKGKPGILPLCEIFRNTTFWEEIQRKVRDWGGDLYVTEDFAKVIQINGVHKSTDVFLRPVQFVASWMNPANGQVKLLVLSSFEINEVMPRIRNCGEGSMQIHVFSRRRFQNQDLLMKKKGLQLPIGRNSSKIFDNCSKALPSLFLASGNLYFNSDEEWNIFRKFLGKTRRSKKKKETGTCDKGVECAFNGDPTQVVKKILSCRHPVLSEVAHVMSLLDEN